MRSRSRSLASNGCGRFTIREGRSEINELHVPVGRPVRLRMISEDVIHSFYIPAFRVKQDVLPGRYASLWFEATRPGSYYLFCAEYCGTDHADMSGRVVAMAPAEYAAWLEGAGGERQATAGERLFTQARCHQCHDRGEDARCPSLEGVFGRRVALSSGGTITSDADYLRESIFDPAAKVVAGYQPVMPTYREPTFRGAGAAARRISEIAAGAGGGETEDAIR